MVLMPMMLGCTVMLFLMLIVAVGNAAEGERGPALMCLTVAALVLSLMVMVMW